MKCLNCGNENQANAVYCSLCGNKLINTTRQTNPQQNKPYYETTQDYRQNNPNYNYQQNPYINPQQNPNTQYSQQYPYMTNNQPIYNNNPTNYNTRQINNPSQKKNKWFTFILSLLMGLGNVYNQLYTRFLVSLVLSTLILIISLMKQELTFIYLIWATYIIYDSLICTKAINDNEEIPLFLNTLDLK